LYTKPGTGSHDAYCVEEFKPEEEDVEVVV